MASPAKIDFVYLSESDMIAAGVTDMPTCVDTMEEMFGLLWHGDYRMAGANNDSHGAMVLFPKESPFPDMPKATADRRFMDMPAYLGGRFRTAGVKWYGSNVENREKGLPRSILMFVLTRAMLSQYVQGRKVCEQAMTLHQYPPYHRLSGKIPHYPPW